MGHSAPLSAWFLSLACGVWTQLLYVDSIISWQDCPAGSCDLTESALRRVHVQQCTSHWWHLPCTNAVAACHATPCGQHIEALNGLLPPRVKVHSTPCALPPSPITGVWICAMLMQCESSLWWLEQSISCATVCCRMCLAC